MRGYKVSTIEIMDTAFLSKREGKYQKMLMIYDANDIVDRTALEITGDELVLADKYEPKNYKRIKVELKSTLDPEYFNIMGVNNLQAKQTNQA